MIFGENRNLFLEKGPASSDVVEAGRVEAGNLPGDLGEKVNKAQARVDASVNSLPIGAAGREALAEQRPDSPYDEIERAEADSAREVADLRGSLSSDLREEGVGVDPRIEAEHVRLSDEMRTLARRNAWKGVEAKWDEMSGLAGVDVTYNDCMLAAQSARALGYPGETLSRLKMADSIQPGQQEVADWIADIEGKYGMVLLAADSKIKGVIELQCLKPPFAPDQRLAIETAQTAIREGRSFRGMLPQGEYVFGDNAFSIEPGGVMKVVELLTDKLKQVKAGLVQAYDEMRGLFKRGQETGEKGFFRGIDAKYKESLHLFKNLTKGGVPFADNDKYHAIGAKAAKELDDTNGYEERLALVDNKFEVRDLLA
ncbi:MAG: hypothetical protein WCT46_06625 [Candidatus Gracilibacteria bacterium]|jgi:hypothetical protein